MKRYNPQSAFRPHIALSILCIHAIQSAFQVLLAQGAIHKRSSVLANTGGGKQKGFVEPV